MQTIRETQALYEVSTTQDNVFIQALRLPPLQKVHLVERLMNVLERELTNEENIDAGSQPRRSLFGVLAPLGTAPSAAEIDEARSEAWVNFPHEDL